MDVAASCSHCGLPAGWMARRQDVNGEDHWFCCHGCCLAFQFRHGAGEAPLAATWLIRLGVGTFLAMNVMLLSLMLYADAFSGDDAWLRDPVHWLQGVLAAPLLVLLGGPFLAAAWQALRQGRLVTDSLVSIGVLGAYGYSVWQLLRGSPLVYFDTAAMVLLLFTLGRTLEAQGRARAARSLAPMLAAERAQATVVQDGVAVLRPVGEVQAGDLVRVLPGERLAVDGVVLEGRSQCDESVLTGQPGPRPKAAGATVWAGSLNGGGLLLVRATAPGLGTRWVQIGRIVREALAAKSLVGGRIDRIAAAFIPAVLLLALATAGFWHGRGGFDAALLAGLAVLVVACPCSLGLAAPLAAMLAIGQAAQRGILVRSGSALEKLASLRGVAFDKTGTLTGDSLRLAGLRLEGASEAQALWRARSLAFGSDHPVARALQAVAAGPQPPVAGALQAVPGAGLLGRVDGERCALGSAGLLASLGWELGTLAGEADQGRTTVLVGWDGRARARFELVAPPVAGAGEVVRALQARRLATLVVSGDGAGAVEGLARQLGIAHWYAGLAPEAKVALLRDWSARHGPIAMVGDGLNDGPVLAAAAVGIAVGGATDLARESADIVLPRDGLASLPWLLDAAQRLHRSVRANLLWAFGYNAVALGLAATGLLRPVLAAALMAGSSLLVVARSWLAQRRAEAADVAAATPSAATASGAALVVLLAVGLAWPAWAHHAPKQAARGDLVGWSVAPFTLTDQAGRPFTDGHLRGRWTFVVLGDTSTCGPPCEAALAALAGLCQRIAPAVALQTTQVLFVSLDPRRDTSARLRTYLAAYDPRFVGATGGTAALERLADDIGGPVPAPGGAPHYRGTLVLVGPDAAIRAEYLPPFDVPRLTAAYLRARRGRS